MRIHYNNMLNELKQETLRMGDLVSEAMKGAIKAFQDMDVAAAEKIIADDEIVNELQMKIEDKSILLIATENPVAIDLRKTIAIIKIISNLERIGDHSVHLAKATIRLADSNAIKPFFDSIPEMAEICLTMINRALEAYRKLDQDMAIKVSKKDDILDEFYRKQFHMITEFMKENPDFIPQAMNLLSIIRFLERFGDHVTNICEWIIYTITAEHVELNN